MYSLKIIICFFVFISILLTSCNSEEEKPPSTIVINDSISLVNTFGKCVKTEDKLGCFVRLNDKDSIIYSHNFSDYIVQNNDSLFFHLLENQTTVKDTPNLILLVFKKERNYWIFSDSSHFMIPGFMGLWDKHVCDPYILLEFDSRVFGKDAFINYKHFFVLYNGKLTSDKMYYEMANTTNEHNERTSKESYFDHYGSFDTIYVKNDSLFMRYIRQEYIITLMPFKRNLGDSSVKTRIYYKGIGQTVTN